jgi:hypothetical protein
MHRAGKAGNADDCDAAGCGSAAEPARDAALQSMPIWRVCPPTPLQTCTPWGRGARLVAERVVLTQVGGGEFEVLLGCSSSLLPLLVPSLLPLLACIG